MKVNVYGSNVCPKTLYTLNLLWGKLPDPSILTFVNVTGSIALLKEFMEMRDTDPNFEAFRGRPMVGFPYFILEDGTRTHDLNKVFEILGV